MAQHTTALLAEQAAMLSTRAEALCRGEVPSLVETLMGSTDTDVLDFHRHATEVLKLAEAAVIAAAGEAARRSESSLPDPLARRLGQKSAGALLALRSGLHERDASAQAKLGLDLTSREGLSGEILPPFYSTLADALATGAVTSRAARLIARTLHTIEPHVSAERLEQTEQALTHGASHEWSALTLDDVCRVLPSTVDPDGAAPREAAVRARRGLRPARVLEDGTLQYLLNLDPESAAFFEAALDARIAPRRQVRFHDVDGAPEEGDFDDAADDGAAGDDAATRDDRTWQQKRADALVDMARESLRHDDGDIGGVDATAVIHVSVETLANGTGHAWLEGIDTPVSAQTARRFASCAEITAVVLDGDGQPLHLGTTRRFFSRAQRRAMAARDGGCQWPGCAAPPRSCDAAHVVPWARGGPTDIANGVLLCHFHHRRFDEDGWTLTFRDGVPWFTPPPHVDASRTPRRGGRVRAPV